jgi:hypothetical protein
MAAMLELILLGARERSPWLAAGHQELILENIALRHQLRVLKRGQASLTPDACMFWSLLAICGTRWRTALMYATARYRGALASRVAPNA